MRVACRPVLPGAEFSAALGAKVQPRPPALPQLPRVFQRGGLGGVRTEAPFEDQVGIALRAVDLGLEHRGELDGIGAPGALRLHGRGVEGKVEGALALRRQQVVLPVRRARTPAVFARRDAAGEPLGVPAAVRRSRRVVSGWESGRRPRPKPKVHAPPARAGWAAEKRPNRPTAARLFAMNLLQSPLPTKPSACLAVRIAWRCLKRAPKRRFTAARKASAVASGTPSPISSRTAVQVLSKWAG